MIIFKHNFKWNSPIISKRLGGIRILFCEFLKIIYSYILYTQNNVWMNERYYHWRLKKKSTCPHKQAKIWVIYICLTHG